MIRVIKRGALPEETPRQAECRKCLSILEFIPKTVQLVFDLRDGDFYQFTCPVCGSNVTVQK